MHLMFLANGGKEDNQQKDGAEIIGDVMASTVTEQCLCSPEGGEDLSADMGCSAASLNAQSEPPIADKKRSEEHETVVHAATHVKQVMVLETELFEQKGNVVLQTLLRAPRYFNFNGSRWELCQRCGEENHGAAGRCPLEKKKRPCFYCGHYGHNGKYCKKVTGCFICKRRGHLAKDCPDAKTQPQDQSCEFCLKCGDTGHEMFTCTDGYCSSDLEKIQCWVCKAFGHLSCIDYKDYGPKQVSCYNCGKLGHLGSDCLNLRWNIPSASVRCKTGRTGLSCSERNNGDRDLLCEDRKSAKVRDLLLQMDVLGSEVASKKISRSRWRKRKRRQRKTEGGRWENGRQCGIRQECQSSEEPKSNVLLEPAAT
ncbi:uncharacterized protein LOC132034499 isoform X2 [Lycium ferocissimum]|uniref:uncharacterized protein LOC132034499 isoform X2 n=1 Tax=Lycium ferocissimum TaxID=112874 RepID=UPI0028160D62|nr:uncharacterized protein LOC132034499 isoform X2 [Lycium ferocissimum]